MSLQILLITANDIDLEKTDLAVNGSNRHAGPVVPSNPLIKCSVLVIQSHRCAVVIDRVRIGIVKNLCGSFYITNGICGTRWRHGKVVLSLAEDVIAAAVQGFVVLVYARVVFTDSEPLVSPAGEVLVNSILPG